MYNTQKKKCGSMCHTLLKKKNNNNLRTTCNFSEEVFIYVSYKLQFIRGNKDTLAFMILKEGESKMTFADSSRKFSVYSKSGLSMQNTTLLIDRKE